LTSKEVDDAAELESLLDQSYKPLALRQGQALSRNVAQIAGSIDRHHVNASARPIDPGFH
jgi:hypothetical protein